MKTLFVDFDGTICTDRFWRSLPDYDLIQKKLFTDSPNVAPAWMRGEYTSEEVNRIVSDLTNIEYETLWNCFVQDCKNMHVPDEILKLIYGLREKYFTVLITGNMDSFSRFTEPSLQLSQSFDVVVNSYEEGQLKTDDNGESFQKYCKGDIKNAILIEDSQKSLDVFSGLGGTAYKTDSLEKTKEILEMLK